jgi:lysozyme family protein
MSFRHAAGFILSAEIGNGAKHWIADDPNDRGGRTVAGVTTKTYREALVRWKEPDRPVDEIRVLEWLRIAREFWDAVRADELPAKLAVAVFDAAYNHGPTRAVILLQRTLAPIASAALKQDGVFGPKTLQVLEHALALHGERQILESYLDWRLVWYERIVATDPTQLKFRDGWRRRVEELRRKVELV